MVLGSAQSLFPVVLAAYSFLSLSRETITTTSNSTNNHNNNNDNTSNDDTDDGNYYDVKLFSI